MLTKTTVAIIAIALLLGVALWRGVDGVLLGSGMTIIGGLGGYAIGKKSK